MAEAKTLTVNSYTGNNYGRKSFVVQAPEASVSIFFVDAKAK
jgi:hypothetical protein